MTTRSLSCLAAFALIMLFSTRAAAQTKVENAAEMKFAPVPGAPACFSMSVEQGDPGSGPGTMFVKATAGCDAPMHFHSVTEQLMMVGGTAYLQMRGEDEVHTLRAGAFAVAPPKHPHHFACATACQFYLVSDGAFDIHYVDASDKEISLDAAAKMSKKLMGSKKTPGAAQSAH
jgi:quercetin dioxygenase-like cupin family protein